MPEHPKVLSRVCGIGRPRQIVARSGIVLIDNYIDERTLMLLGNRDVKVSCEYLDGRLAFIL